MSFMKRFDGHADISQFRTELLWLRRLRQTHRRRAPARHPVYSGETNR